MEELPSSKDTIESQTAPADDYVKFDPEAAKKIAEEAEQIKKKRMIGAKVLSAAGFNNHHQKIVNSSFEKARKVKQKLVGNNGERRSDAYLTRIDRIVDRYGTIAEQKLWDASSASSEIVIKPENVPDSFWKTQAQIRRDNGINEYISDYEKELLVEDAQKRQYESIKNWSDYLSQEDCPYPIWFKLFAWDGVTKMSAVYDKDSQHFTKRDKTTMAPYPHLSPAVLAQIYSAICKVNGLDECDEIEEPSLDDEAEEITKTYNFNKLYSLFLSRQKVAPEVPKDPKKVHGDWVEYRPGDEKALAEAAAGTPWCIASPVVGKNYLMKGKYGTDEVEKTESKARFILFHLRDESTDKLATSACASIRLDVNGNVAEISGIQNGQVLDDALVPTVERKVVSLPGGKKYLEAFADKHRLIELDKKMQSGEELTDDELRFIYELDRPIQKIEQFGKDTRVEKAKQKYPPSELIKRKISNVGELKQIIKRKPIEDITQFIDAGVDIKNIINAGAFGIQDVDELLGRNISHKDIINVFARQGEWIFKNYDYLASRGFTAAEIAKQTPTSILLGHLDLLDENNIPYNLRKMIHKAIKQHDEDAILDNSEAIIARGGKINFKKIAKRMNPQEIIHHASSFCNNSHREIVEKAIARLKKSEDSASYNFIMSSNLETLLDGGIEIANLKEIANSQNRNIRQVLLSLDKLSEHGIDVKIDVAELTKAFIGGNKRIADVIIKHPEKFNPKEVYEIMPRWAVIEYFDELIKNGVEINVEQLATGEVGPAERLLSKEAFEKHGVKIDVDSEISKLSSEEAFHLLNNYLNDKTTPIVQENVDMIVARLLSGIDNNKLSKKAKPLLWRLGYIK